MSRWTQCSRTIVLVLAAVRHCVAAPDEIRFNRDVRPILSNNCFYCHGPDEKHREAELRLDVRESAIAERDGVRAIVPGKPDESDLIVRVLPTDKDEVMPPPESKKPLLTERRRSRSCGAGSSRARSTKGTGRFMPLREAAPPAVKDAAWVQQRRSIASSSRGSSAKASSPRRKPIAPRCSAAFRSI